MSIRRSESKYSSAWKNLHTIDKGDLVIAIALVASTRNYTMLGFFLSCELESRTDDFRSHSGHSVR